MDEEQTDGKGKKQIYIYIERHTKQPRKWMRKRKERAKEREMESSRERSLKWREERKRVWRGWSRARERERERRRRRTWVCYRDGQGAANVYNINANGLPYTLYTIPTLHQPSLPLSLSLSLSLFSPFTSPDTLLAKVQDNIHGCIRANALRRSREKGGERWLVSDRETTREKELRSNESESNSNIECRYKWIYICLLQIAS